MENQQAPISQPATNSPASDPQSARIVTMDQLLYSLRVSRENIIKQVRKDLAQSHAATIKRIEQALASKKKTNGLQKDFADTIQKAQIQKMEDKLQLVGTKVDDTIQKAQIQKIEDKLQLVGTKVDEMVTRLNEELATKATASQFNDIILKLDQVIEKKKCPSPPSLFSQALTFIKNKFSKSISPASYMLSDEEQMEPINKKDQ